MTGWVLKKIRKHQVLTEDRPDAIHAWMETSPIKFLYLVSCSKWGVKIPRSHGNKTRNYVNTNYSHTTKFSFQLQSKKPVPTHPCLLLFWHFLDILTSDNLTNTWSRNMSHKRPIHAAHPKKVNASSASTIYSDITRGQATWWYPPDADQCIHI